MTANKFPIRILCVFSVLDYGGAETMCMNLFRRIDRNRVIFDFVKHCDRQCEYDEEILSLGGRIFTAPSYRTVNAFEYNLWWKKHLESHPEHIIIHSHYFTIAGKFLKIAKKYGRITISHSHNTGVRGKGLAKYYKRYLSAQAEEYADYCFACSESAGNWLFKNKPFIVLKNGIEAKRFALDEHVKNEVQRELNIHGHPVIGTVGSFMEVKNPKGIIRIFEEILKKNPNAQLLWVGKGPLYSHISDIINEKEYKDSVYLLGRRTDVNRVLQIMDAFILPSYHEGLPVSLIEAQAAGLSCFCSDKITKEVDVTGRCEFLQLNDYEKWADSILNSNLSKNNNSEIIIKSGYDISTTAQWLQEFYCDISNRN